MGEARFVLENCPKTDEEKREISMVPNAIVVGNLMYLCTRHNIHFAVGLVSRYQNNPGRAHWWAVKQVFRYLHGTTNRSLGYRGANFRLKGILEANSGGNLDESKSTFRYAFILGGGGVS